MRDAIFLRRSFRPGDQVHIMSCNSGFFHAMTGTTDPLDVPGAAEFVYRRDFSRRDDYLQTLPGPAVIDRAKMEKRYLETLLSRYPASQPNPDGKLVILRR